MSTETGTGNKSNGLLGDLERLQSDWDRQERAEPPDLLDQAVLNAARRDLAPASRGKRLGWISGFATAGIAVVALSIVLLQETPQPPVPVPFDTPEETSAKPVPEKGRVLSSPARAMKKQDMREELRAEEPAENAAFQAAPAAAAAPEAEAMRDSVARLRMAEEPKEELLESADAAATTLAPEAWLEELLRLQKQGDEEGLAKQLQAFRKAYPDYPLPEVLQD